MAHEFARYLTSTHFDPGWSRLTTTEHDCFMALVSSPDITWAGVVPYLPRRFARFATDLTPAKVERVWRDLADARLIVIDQETEEIAVRSFLRNDGVLSQPNIAVAFGRAMAVVSSPRLRAAILAEASLLYVEHRTDWAASWAKLRAADQQLMDSLEQEASA